MIRENRKVDSCNHEAFIAEKHVYCPDCGDTGVEMILTRRIAELETLLRAEQGYTELNEAKISELEQLEESNGETRRGMDAQLARLEKVAEAAASFYSDATLYYPLQHHGLEDALRAAGYGGGDE